MIAGKISKWAGVNPAGKDSLMRWILGAVGLAMLGAGAVRAVSVGGQPGIVVLITAGGVLILSPFVIDRLESVTAGTANVELRFTQKIVELGAPKAAAILGRTDLANLVQSYAFVRAELPIDRFGDARMYLQDLLVERSAAVAQSNKLDPREVRILLADGPAVVRVVAIGLMTGDHSLADGRSIAAAIGEPLSENEQYHALRLASQCWPRLPQQDRRMIHASVRTAEASRAIPLDSDRSLLADALLGLPVD